MTECNLHASRDFFKEISIESKRIKLMASSIQTFIDQARVRGCRVGDNELLTLLDHMESFFAIIQESSDRLEKICARL
ncbi:MAG: hypothetical protein H0X26_04850 [Alphaproteobacteria bacterium]|nr:hypothetical protein [Alphaproteobacteria bacterium]